MFLPHFDVLCDLLIGSLSNHDERDDDDVKWARKDWDENVVFEGKMKLKQWGCW